MNSKEFFKTSQPSPQEFLDIFEEVKEREETLICLTLSREFDTPFHN
ncbi:DegV family protein [uncultured Holdemanella sp.]|nr:DegV family protein [uncultured Holdemanella sp.]